MFKLTIGEMNCAVSDFEHDTFCFYTFDARKDIFNLNDGDNGLVRFVQSVKPVRYHHTRLNKHCADDLRRRAAHNGY